MIPTVRGRLRRIGMVVAVSALTIAMPRTTVAGTILVSGDSNITDVLASGPNTNTQFFLNVLGLGDLVTVLDFTNASFGSASNTDVEANAFYDALAGVTSTLISGTVTAAALAGVDLFVVPTPDDNFAASEVLAISAFLNAGGTLFLLGENANTVFNTSNTAINQLLDALGSTINLVPGFFGPPGTYTADPFTQGLVGDLFMPFASQITGGKTLYTTTGGVGLLAREEIGTASVPEPTGTLLLLTGLFGVGVRRWKQRRA